MKTYDSKLKDHRITLVIKSKLTYLYAMGLPKQLSEQQSNRSY